MGSGEHPETQRKIDVRVNVDLATLPGPSGFLNGPGFQVHGGCITEAAVASWPYSINILLRFTGFLSTLHWPAHGGDMGHFGISFLELLILFEQWSGYWLLSEKDVKPGARANRPSLFQKDLKFALAVSL